MYNRMIMVVWMHILAIATMTTAFLGTLHADEANDGRPSATTSRPATGSLKEVAVALAKNQRQLEQLLILAQGKPWATAAMQKPLADMARRAELAGFVLEYSPAEVRALFALDTVHPEIVLPSFSKNVSIRIKALRSIARLPDDSFRQAEPLIARGLDSNVPAVQIAAANSVEAKASPVSCRLRESLLAVLSRAKEKEWSRHIVLGEHIEGNMPVLRQVVWAVISAGDLHVAKGVVELLSQQKNRCVARSMWLCHILNRIGDTRVVPRLAAVLSDKSQRRPLLRHVLRSPASRSRITAYIAPSDTVLLTLLTLTRQPYDRYGFETRVIFTQTRPPFFGFPSTESRASTEARAAAVKMFTAWWSKHKGEYGSCEQLPNGRHSK